MSSNDVAASAALGELARACKSRLIMRDEGAAVGKEIPYLWRSYMAGVDGSKSCNAFLHRFVSSDAVGELHNHPWEWSVSFILAGVYREVVSQNAILSYHDGVLHEASLKRPVTRVLSVGDRNFIADTTFHRVDLLTPEVWTLFVHGPRTKDGLWGFVREGEYEAYLPMRVIREKTSSRLEER